jgi:hypothetical protein
MNEHMSFSQIPIPRSAIKDHQAEMTSTRKSWRRRWVSWAGAAMVLGATGATAQSSRESWYFSAADIGAAYQYQEAYGGRMRNPLPAFSCMTGNTDFAATYRGVPVQVACRFINEVMRHLKGMLDIGAARYLFPLDADHAHLAVPADVWAEKYDKLSPAQLMVALLREPKLVALYHTAEHLEPGAKINGTDDAGVRRWREQRNVLGYFNGRPLQVLPPHPDGFGVGLPDGLVSYGGFNFLASPRGELMILQGERAIAFDVSLEMEEPAPNVFGRSLARTAPALRGSVGR